MQDITSTLLARLRISPETLTVDERTLLAEAASSAASLLITQKAAALLLGVDRTTIWRLVRDGLLVPVEVVPGTPRYRKEDIEFLAHHGWQRLVAARRNAA